MFDKFFIQQCLSSNIKIYNKSNLQEHIQQSINLNTLKGIAYLKYY